MFKKFLFILAALLISIPAYAGDLELTDNGTSQGRIRELDVIGATVSRSGGTGTVDVSASTGQDINNPDIDGGTIDGTVIGGATPAAGTFTTLTANSTLTGGAAWIGSSESVTTSSADPGLGVANLTTLTTLVTTDDTGTAADQVSLADGTANQIKVIALVADTEAAGLSVIPANFGPGTSVLLEDVGDSVTLQFDGTNWQLINNDGGTIA